MSVTCAIEGCDNPARPYSSSCKTCASLLGRIGGCLDHGSHRSSCAECTQMVRDYRRGVIPAFQPLARSASQQAAMYLKVRLLRAMRASGGDQVVVRYCETTLARGVDAA